MKKELFCVYDSVTNTFNIPFASSNDAEAFRMLAGAMTPDTTIYDHSDDYSVYYVGEFDMETGQIQDAVPSMVFRVRQVRDSVDAKTLKEMSDDS